HRKGPAECQSLDGQTIRLLLLPGGSSLWTYISGALHEPGRGAARGLHTGTERALPTEQPWKINTAALDPRILNLNEAKGEYAKVKDLRDAKLLANCISVESRLLVQNLNAAVCVLPRHCKFPLSP